MECMEPDLVVTIDTRFEAVHKQQVPHKKPYMAITVAFHHLCRCSLGTGPASRVHRAFGLSLLRRS